MKKLLCIVSVLSLGTMAFAVKDVTIQEDQCLLQQEGEITLPQFEIELKGIKFRVCSADAGENKECSVPIVHSTCGYCYHLEPLYEANLQNFEPITFQISSGRGIYDFQPIFQVDNDGGFFCPVTQRENLYGYDYLMQEIIQQPVKEQEEVSMQEAKTFSPKIIFKNGDELFPEEEHVAITCLQEGFEKRLQQKLKRKQRDKEKSIIEEDAKFLFDLHVSNAKKYKKRRNTKTFHADEIFTWGDNSKQCIYGPVIIENQKRPEVSFEKSVHIVCGDNKHMYEMVNTRFKSVFESFQASPEKIKKFFDLLETGSFSGLLQFFIENKIFDATTNSIELTQDKDNLVDLYTMFLEIMLDNYVADKDVHDVILFNIAKRLFAIFFETEKKYKEVLENGFKKNNNHPFLRFCYAVMQYHLTQEGWMHWSKNALDSLKTDYDNGQEIVYIAGGCDVLELIKYGIYNIRVIDPFLEDQAPFYTNGWKTMIKGPVGTKIVIDKELILTCEKINEIQTLWSIDSKNGTKKGMIVFERRYCNQSDFNIKGKADQTILLSFNELGFLISRQWKIYISNINEKKSIIVKQLGLIKKPALKRLQTIEDAFSPIFIPLGASSKKRY